MGCVRWTFSTVRKEYIPHKENLKRIPAIRGVFNFFPSGSSGSRKNIASIHHL